MPQSRTEKDQKNRGSPATDMDSQSSSEKKKQYSRYIRCPCPCDHVFKWDGSTRAREKLVPSGLSPTAKQRAYREIYRQTKRHGKKEYRYQLLKEQFIKFLQTDGDFEAITNRIFRGLLQEEIEELIFFLDRLVDEIDESPSELLYLLAVHLVSFLQFKSRTKIITQKDWVSLEDLLETSKLKFEFKKSDQVVEFVRLEREPRPILLADD